MTKYAHIVGWGMYVPENVVTNEELTRGIDTSDEWIKSRTGIEARHIVEEDESTASMAIYAAREALDRARIHPSDVDLVIVATMTSDHIMPSTACLVQNALGAKRAAAFDLNAACTGFVYGVSVATGMIRAEQAKVAVVIGADTMSCLVDWEDRATCVLFGDGAGAVVLKEREEPGGVLGTVLGSDGAGSNHLIVPAGGSKMPTTSQTVEDRQHFIKMNGKEVFRFATRAMGKAAREACHKANIELSMVDLLIPHQANVRIIQSAAKYLNLDTDKVYKNLHKYGNTSSASIPIALCEAIQEGRVKDDQHLIFVGFGGGLTWGAMVVKWGLPVPYQKRKPLYRIMRRTYYRWAEFVGRMKWYFMVMENFWARNIVRRDRDKPKDNAKNEKPKSAIKVTVVKQNDHHQTTQSNGHNHNHNSNGAKQPYSNGTVEEKNQTTK